MPSTTSLKKNILRLSEKYFDTIRSIRRHLHQYPELSFQEYQTSQYIENILKEWNVPCKRVARTGLIAYIGNTRSKKCIALRADIDALPIQEKNTQPYTSKNAGIMHGCGHDVHTACALGSIRVLKDLEPHINGCIKIFFQPGEEVLPGGAQLLIKEGSLRQPKVQSIIAQHVFPDLEAGQLGFRAGPYMASTDEIHITIKGKGGHGAMPQKAQNPIPVAAALIHQITNDYPLERMIKEQIILSFGKINAPGATNVIPDTTEIAGTMRTVNSQKRESLYKYLKQTTQKISKQFKTAIELNIVKGYPPLVNDETLTKFFQQKAAELLGPENIVELPVRMTADDFAYYLQHIPGTYYRLGTGNKKKGITHNVHTAYFDIDETALYYGTASMSWLSVNYILSDI